MPFNYDERFDPPFLWVIVDDQLHIAPEQQPNWQRPLKHGDLVPGPGGQYRGAAVLGGELNFSNTNGKWRFTLDSSYAFNRADGLNFGGRQNPAPDTNYAFQALWDVLRICRVDPREFIYQRR